ncbi:glycosyltransferase [Planctomyces sp. SH-PL62]|uniref:tetratricopeptide repeat-containing glycosyltransferase n=1 Tax=Planctomyces sp. SH-PL62 TaxID=1636152 RepID=UPI00078E9FBD|nr:glycosyltransferase [Planctomyces sp. SH-PL62]AMV37777.1 SPBc2 prophage-derived glycosyltransferase SunS [Planctomyces sp. SH-PL62]
MNARESTICLGMIVKDEAPVIRRCLESVRPFIDTWVIADTGSTDGTQDLIRDALGGLPGTLLQRPWVDFAHNRNEVLDAARDRAAYTFTIDADETLAFDDGFERPKLEADSYDVTVHYGSTCYHRKQLVRGALPWKYRGVLHEYLTCPEARTEAHLPGLRTIVTHDGARAHDPLTYRRDALLLEKALVDEPANERYVFYLAQSYRDAGELDLAIRNYRRRLAMGGWSEEVWYALFQIAVLRERRGDAWPEVLADYLTAFEHSPDRAEPLYKAGMHHQAAREFHTAQLFFRRALDVPRPDPRRLFVWRTVYDYLLELEYGVSLYYTGGHAEAIAVADRLLTRGNLPPDLAKQVAVNRRLSVEKLPAVRV